MPPSIILSPDFHTKKDQGYNAIIEKKTRDGKYIVDIVKLKSAPAKPTVGMMMHLQLFTGVRYPEVGTKFHVLGRRGNVLHTFVLNKDRKIEEIKVGVPLVE
jgi:hypothetical protein